MNNIANRQWRWLILNTMFIKKWIVFLAAVLLSFSVLARDNVSSGEVALGSLPAEAQYTLRLIKAGGPFPYAKDGVTFGNYERLLPRQPRGYYREFTVKTPNVRHRGARRIVSGGVPETSGEYYYTSDHYATFRRIRE
jgi:ribonuclease T1